MKDMELIRELCDNHEDIIRNVRKFEDGTMEWTLTLPHNLNIVITFDKNGEGRLESIY